MRETNEKVYRCDFCNKASFNKGFMKLHERMCRKNPKNRHKCFQYCKFLIKTVDEEGEVCFHCEKQPILKLYSYKLERYKRNAERIKELTRMPLKCYLYEIEGGHYDYKPF